MEIASKLLECGKVLGDEAKSGKHKAFEQTV
jgi:hypothetical protein